MADETGMAKNQRVTTETVVGVKLRLIHLLSQLRCQLAEPHAASRPALPIFCGTKHVSLGDREQGRESQGEERESTPWMACVRFT